MPQKEIIIPNCPNVYRVMNIAKDRKQIFTGQFRVRKRLKDELTLKWTMQTQTFSDFDEAKRFAKSPTLRNSISPSKRLTFRETFDRFLAHKQISKKRRGSLEGILCRYPHLKFFEAFPMQAITPRVVDRWLELIHDPKYKALSRQSRLSYKHEFSVLRGILRYYRNYIDDSYTVPLLDRHRELAFAKSRDRQETEIRFLTEEQEIEFLQVLHEVGSTYHDLALLQLHTGARIGEAAGLEFRNIDFRSNEILICQHVDWPRRSGQKIEILPGTKTGGKRRVPLTDECRDMLRRRMTITQSQIVFPNPKTMVDWLAYRQIQFAYDKAFKQVSETVRGTHSLRHTFAVRFLNKVKDIYALQKLLGHASLEETQVYAKYSYDSVRQAFQVFNGGKSPASTEAAERLVSPFVSANRSGVS